MTLPFKIYQVKNKASQQSFVYMGKPALASTTVESFYDHMYSSKNCEDVYLFTTLVGSKNVRLTPSTLKPRTELNNEVLKDPFVHIDTRWYHFRYPGTENDVPENLPPNNFIKYHSGSRGDYTVEWRKLTSDGSVLIKPSLFSSVFWNGGTYISDTDAGYFEKPFNQKSLNDDLIYLKTRHYIDVLRNTIKGDSLSLIYKKYIDECKWKSTFIMKRFRGSYCVNVLDKSSHIEVGVKPSENRECECGCISCWEIVNGEAILKYSKLDMNQASSNNLTDYSSEREELINRWTEYKAYTSDLDNATPVTMNWIEQFEYNWLNNLGYNRYNEFPLVVSDEKTVNIKFNKFSDRQNRFYGINPRTATREHHAMPPVKPTEDNPHIYSYKNTHSLFHPDFFMESMSGYFDRYATTPTKLITKGRIDDGKERVVVPPGVIFRTYKAVPGILSLYELDSPFRRPDEYHFAVDGYGNILGYKSLPYPALIATEYTVEVSGANVSAVDDVSMRDNVKQAWECYFTNGKNGFCNEETLDNIHKHRIDNNYFVLAKTNNPQDKDYLVSCEVMSGASTISVSGDDGWVYTGNLNENRKHHASVKLNDGKILVTGGFDNPNYILASCEIYDPNTGLWTPATSMNVRRYSHTATLLADGNVLVTGGYNEDGTMNSCEIYNTTLNTWSVVNSMSDTRQNHTATLMSNGNVFVAGGLRYGSSSCGSYSKAYISKCEIYDITTGSWIVCGYMPKARVDHTSTLLLDGNILIYGGHDGNNFNDTYDYYDVVNSALVNSITTFGKRRKHTANLLPDGKVIFIGGYDENGPLNTCDVFNTYSISAGSSISRARFGHTSVSDGNYIHIVGGSDFVNYVKTSEVYDIVNQTWYDSVDNLIARFGHTSHIINGNTLVVGGRDESYINEAELISGGAVHTYVNIHHCPIWIDRDIFCSYHAVESPSSYNGNDYLDCGGNNTIPCDDPCDIPPDGVSSSSSSSSSTPPTSGVEVSSSSSSDDRVSIIVNDDVTPVVTSSSSSTFTLDEFNEPRQPVTYQDDIATVNPVHGSIDVTEAGNYTFTVPDGVTRIKVMLWGAGGGGGGYAHIDITNLNGEHSISKSSGGGGGGGGHLRVVKSVSPATTYNFTVGKGGLTGSSVIVNGITDTTGITSWYNSSGVLIQEPNMIQSVNGSKGGDTIFDTVKAYGGNGGTGGVVRKSNGLAGKGGYGSPGGTSPTLHGVETYNGKNGENGEYIQGGPKGPAHLGGTPGFAIGAIGGQCSVPGAGEGGDGRRNSTDTVVDGQDGRLRIEW